MQRQRLVPGFTLLQHDQGVVLLSVLILLAVLTVVSAASMTATLMDLRISGYHAKSMVVFYVAEAGANRARYEISDGDGYRDFSSISGPMVMFQGEVLNGGSYTVVATPVAASVPARVKLESTACYPAADPCPAEHATSMVEFLVESNPEATEPEEGVRVVAWKEAN